MGGCCDDEFENLDLLGLQTAYMRRDLITQATCYALEPFWISLSEVINMVLVLPMIDHLPEAALDELAWQYHVDAYDATAAPAEKRRMIKSSFTVHKYKGSVYAVKQLVDSVFGAQANIVEWFDYDGQPYHFKVEVYCIDRGAGEADIRRAEQLVEAGKNLRSILDEIRLVLIGVAQTGIAAAAIQSEAVTVYPKEAV